MAPTLLTAKPFRPAPKAAAEAFFESAGTRPPAPPTTAAVSALKTLLHPIGDPPLHKLAHPRILHEFAQLRQLFAQVAATPVLRPGAPEPIGPAASRGTAWPASFRPLGTPASTELAFQP